jgi:O-acetylhomoserine (thiol)-lyase
VGIEDIEDLIADLQTVFESVSLSQFSINKN